MHFLIQTKSWSSAWNLLSTVSKLNQVISQRVLSVQFAAKKDLTVSIQKDLEEEYSREIPANKNEFFEASGKLKLEHPDWVIEVSSGEEDTEEIIRDYRIAEKELKKLLMEYDVESLDQALALHEEYRKLKTEFDIVDGNLKMELGGRLRRFLQENRGIWTNPRNKSFS